MVDVTPGKVALWPDGHAGGLVPAAVVAKAERVAVCWA